MLVLGLLVSLLATISAHPGNVNLLQCRSAYLKMDANQPIIERIRTDLLQGIWVRSGQTPAANLMQFRSGGEAIILKSLQLASVDTEKYRWKLEESMGAVVLVLSRTSGATVKRYFLDPTCDGMVLTNARTGKQTTYEYEPAIDYDSLEKMRQSLSGEWVSLQGRVALASAKPNGREVSKLRSASIRFKFRKDGTFTKEISSNTSDVYGVERGRWELIKNGKFLLLHTINQEKVVATHCARIRHLELDELVLEQQLKVSGKFVADWEGDTTFYFNKQ